uniref:Uncharacterized protein n=1 Tax=Avena sativa TaxID=4498 RepID=A0ACD5YKP5_AVESA
MCDRFCLGVWDFLLVWSVCMNRLRNMLLRRCKSLSRSRSSSSYSNLRSMSARDIAADEDDLAAYDAGGDAAVVFVGSSRRRYVISAKHLSHPLIAALIVDTGDGDGMTGRNEEEPGVAVKCEVVLFDHLLWMLDNAADLRDDDGGDAARELAQLYATC